MSAPVKYDEFADDVLERLARSNADYQREHGHYIVPLAKRLLEARKEVARWREHASAAYQTVEEIERDYYDAQSDIERFKKCLQELLLYARGNEVVLGKIHKALGISR